MHYFVTIVYSVTSGNAMNVLGTAITSDSFLVSKQDLRCQRNDWRCHFLLEVSFFIGRQIISNNKSEALVNLLSIE